MKRFLSVLISILLLSSQAFSEEAEIQGNNVETSDETLNPKLIITKINFTGLKRTKDSYIQSKVKKYIGCSLEEFNRVEFETVLQMEGIFNNIQISTKQHSETEAQIDVSVEEKITLIPLPFAMVSSSSFMAGGIVMDTNAFGVKDMFMLGGLYTSGSVMGIASFAKSPTNDGAPGYSAFFSASKNSSETTNLKNETNLEYKSLAMNVSISLSEKIGEHNTISASSGFRMIDASQVDQYPDVGSGKFGTFGLSWNISYPSWNGWFMSTSGAELSAQTSICTNSDFNNAYEISGGFTFQKPVIPRMRFYTKASGTYSAKTHISNRPGRGSGSVSILPEKFHTEKIYGGNTGLEFAVKKAKYAMISIYGDYQYVYFEDLDEEYEFCHGPNGGVRVYLSKIAFPALALGISYNVPQNLWQFSAALGVSF